MNERITMVELTLLGLDGASLGAGIDLPEPATRVARGFVRAEAASDPAAWETLRVNLPEATRAGFELSRAAHDPSWLLVRQPGHVRPLDVRGAATAQGSVLVSGDEVWLNLETLPRAVALMAADGTGLLVHRDPNGGPKVFPLVLDPLELPAPLEVVSPVAEWVAQEGDPWLRELVEERLNIHDGFATLIAAGCYVRLRDAGPDELAAITSGVGNRSLGRDGQWARALPADVVDGALARLWIAADRVTEALEEIAREADLEESHWRARLLGVLHERDDLEGVALLLAAAGAGVRAQEILRALDAAGEAAMRTLTPVPEMADDERLSRASVVSPMGWWTEVVEWA